MQGNGPKSTTFGLEVGIVTKFESGLGELGWTQEAMSFTTV